MADPKRVLVLWANDDSPNLGVRVLAHGTAALVRNVWPDAEITYYNYGSHLPELPIGRLRSLLWERVIRRARMQRWFRRFDVAIDTRSGDSFTDAYGLRRLATMTTVGLFAAQSGLPIVLGPQTIGPFTTLRGHLLARLTLGSAKLVLARDSASAAACIALGFKAPTTTTDVVFALPAPRAPRTRDVVLNISGLLWNENAHVDHEKYRLAVQHLARRLHEEGRELTLLAHVVHSENDDSDIVATGELEALLTELGIEVEVVVPRTLDDARAAVASARLVVASRMHACLNAISVGVPAVALAYSDKFDPLLADLGWRHTVDLRDDTEPVVSALREIAAAEIDDIARTRNAAEHARYAGELALAHLRLSRSERLTRADRA